MDAVCAARWADGRLEGLGAQSPGTAGTVPPPPRPAPRAGAPGLWAFRLFGELAQGGALEEGGLGRQRAAGEAAAGHQGAIGAARGEGAGRWRGPGRVESIPSEGDLGSWLMPETGRVEPVT